MEKIKRFVSLYVPVTNCSLRCHYCYITHNRLFNGKEPELKYSPETVRMALSKKRLGGTCLINFCGGGETLLPEKVLAYVRVLLEEGHYVMIVTNATTTKRFEQLSRLEKELRSRLFFKFSYHYMELKGKKLLEQFFNNVTMMRDAGCSFTLEATPSDELVPFIDEMRNMAIQKVGANCHITIARDERVKGELPILTGMSKDEYYKQWDIFASSFFEYKKTIFGIKRKEFCYAGCWSFLVDVGTGIMKQCYSSHYEQQIFENVEKPIRFLPVGHNCTKEHCYNGHAFLVLGVIPELPAPNYGEIRNKLCFDGSEWLKPSMKEFMSTKLFESNKELSCFEKVKVDIEIRVRRFFMKIIRFHLKILKNLHNKKKKWS